MGRVSQVKTNKNHRKPRKGTIVSGVIVIAICAVVLALFLAWANKPAIETTELEGLWVCDSVTSYEFHVDNTGTLHVSENEYRFSYQIKRYNLHIDFSENIVQDCIYEISINDKVLTLIGGKGTSGGEYHLAKKDW